MKNEIKCEISQIKSELKIFRANKNKEMVQRFKEMLAEAQQRLREV